MRFRTFAWLAVAGILVAGNAAIVLRLQRASRGSARRRAAFGGLEEAPREPAVRPRAPSEEERSFLDAAPAAAFRLRVAAVDAAGRPLAGVDLVAVADASPFLPAPEVLGRATTGPGGTAEVPLSRRVLVLLEASKAGFAPARIRTRAADVAVRLLPAGSLRGRMLEEGSGAAVAGARVRLVPAEDQERSPDSRAREAEAAALATTSGPDGAFRVEGLGAGTWRVHVDPVEHVPFLESVEISRGEVRRDFEVRRGFRIRGRVVVPGFDRPVSGGTVAWDAPADRRDERPVGTRSATIGPDGRFVLAGLPQPVRVFRVETGGQIYEHVVSAEPVYDAATGEQVGETVLALPGNNVDPSARGRVTDGAGRPVEGALVVLGTGIFGSLPAILQGRYASRLATRTDAAGEWRLVFSGMVIREALVLHPDFAPEVVPVPRFWRDRKVDATLHRAFPLLVSVRDAAGRPAEGAEVFALFEDPVPEARVTGMGDVLATLRAHPLTDAAGRAVLEGFGRGSWYVCARSADGTQFARVLLETGPDGPAAVDLVLAPAPPVEGAVRIPDGTPVAGAWVWITGRTIAASRWARTGADGRFRFEGVVLPAWWPDTDRVAIGVDGARVVGPAEFLEAELDGRITVCLVPLGSDTELVIEWER